MIAISFGTIPVAVAGVPVLMSTVMTALKIPLTTKLNRLIFRPALGNSASYFVGLSSTAPGSGGLLNSSTGLSVLFNGQIPAATGRNDEFVLSAPGQDNTVQPADFALDVSSGGDSIVVFGEQV
jgi:hypothetical protein